MVRRIARDAVDAANSLFNNPRSSRETNQIEASNRPRSNTPSSPPNGGSVQSDYQVRDTGYKRQFDRANGRHVVPATGKY